jgi:L-ascorbate metabolism protein UlaG (beta-lactamase superfamily)
MKTIRLLCLLLCLSFSIMAQPFETDTFETSAGPLTITFIGHGSVMMEWDGKIIHVDPSTREADYAALPDADLILITHHHGDHCDAAAVEQIEKAGTQIILTELANDVLKKGEILPVDGSTTFERFKIHAIPAYNLVHTRDNGDPYHPKGTCNSYVLEAGDMRIFFGGDTENTPEMKALKDIDIAFLPMNLPYTMTPEMVADAARGFRPDILYPYHYGDTDPTLLANMLANENEIEVRIRKMP